MPLIFSSSVSNFHTTDLFNGELLKVLFHLSWQKERVCQVNRNLNRLSGGTDELAEREHVSGPGNGDRHRMDIDPLNMPQNRFQSLVVSSIRIMPQEMGNSCSKKTP